MAWLPCPYLDASVEWTAERWGHIRARHRYFTPADRALVADVLRSPAEVRQRQSDLSEFLFVRTMDSVVPLAYVVAVRLDHASRWWIVTAYRSDRPISTGDVLWSDDEA